MRFVASPVNLIVCLPVCTFLQKAIILKFEAKNDLYQSEGFVCVCKHGVYLGNLADAFDWLRGRLAFNGFLFILFFKYFLYSHNFQ